jgi:hypothetical protein
MFLRNTFMLGVLLIFTPHITHDFMLVQYQSFAKAKSFAVPAIGYFRYSRSHQFSQYAERMSAMLSLLRGVLCRIKNELRNHRVVYKGIAFEKLDEVHQADGFCSAELQALRVSDQISYHYTSVSCSFTMVENQNLPNVQLAHPRQIHSNDT